MRKTFLLALVMFATVMFPATAYAANPVPDNLLISLWPEYSSSQVFFMQQIKLPADTPLPATVRFAFPLGLEMRWTGEILGTDVSKDIPATPVITHKDGYDEVAFTLTKSRVAQAEAMWNGLISEGNNRTVTLDYVQRYETKTTTFEYLQPSDSSAVVMSPASITTRQSPEGLTYHLSSPKVLAVGQTEAFKVTYTRTVTTPSVSEDAANQTAAQAGAAAKDPVNPWILVFVFLIAGVGIAAFVFNEKSKNDAAAPLPGKKNAASKKVEAASTGKKNPIIGILIIVAVLGAFAVYSFTNTSSAPTGNNCEENVNYLQKGVDEYKTAFGVAPTTLGQLMKEKDGKGPFVETISLKCPSDGTYYTVENGKVVQSESTEPPK